MGRFAGDAYALGGPARRGFDARDMAALRGVRDAGLAPDQGQALQLFDDPTARLDASG
jgi:hypothetical protein